MSRTALQHPGARIPSGRRRRAAEVDRNQFGLFPQPTGLDRVQREQFAGLDECLDLRVETVSLSDYVERQELGLSRKLDPESSRDAAREALDRGVIPKHEERIVHALREAGRPLTAKEIGQRVGLDHIQVHRRLGIKGGLRRADGPVYLVHRPYGEKGEQLFALKDSQ